jgi:nicotinamide mononucleotide adenylyltransferase
MITFKKYFEGEERPRKEASFALGRMNPAHRGHGLLVEAIESQPGDAFLFLTDRPAKLPGDPLKPEEKLEWAQTSFPDTNISLSKNIFSAAIHLYNAGYTDITIFEGEDKLRPLLERYNNKQATHGEYNFNSIKQVIFKRDENADDSSGASATKLRDAAREGDYKTFIDNVTEDAKPYAKVMFKKLQGLLA